MRLLRRNAFHALSQLTAILGLALSTSLAQAADFNLLLDKINERVAIADQVALSKWDSGKPVFDAQREADVLVRVGSQASAHGLLSDDARRFFTDQIEANKWVQYGLLAQWHMANQAPDTTRPDLASLRQRLDRLQGELLNALRQAEPIRHREECPHAAAAAIDAYATAHSLDSLHRLALVRGMANVCQGPQAVAQTPGA
ncbi:chorismate mutase [Pseudomonas duriflava]|uniref:Chorismate mutase n=1 Tax=Pseudomonas duriflava TaxID=459528 RepID=A0A562PYQ4_9PSED|nr:chorismate mutase [Pseudomonas duriflava]TWI49300.1 chorismate mutase [Pseudomonas duriflava]